MLGTARGYLNSGRLQAPMTPLAAATFQRDRVAPPRLALLTEGIAPANVDPPALTAITPVTPPPVDTTVVPPVVTSFLAGGMLTQQRPVARTTVASLTGPAAAAGRAAAVAGGAAAQATSLPRVPAPTLASVTAGLDPALSARLRLTPPLPRAVASADADGSADGLAPSDGGPVTRRAAGASEAHALPGLDAAAAALLSAHETAFTGEGTTLRPGDVLVTTLPNHGRDLDGTAPRPVVSVAGDAAVRVVALSALGEVLADQTTNQADVPMPQHTARLAAWCVGGQVEVTPAVLAGPAAGSPAGRPRTRCPTSGPGSAWPATAWWPGCPRRGAATATRRPGTIWSPRPPRRRR